MGTPVDPDRPDDGPARRVRISHGFYIDEYEVTFAQFVRFLRDSGQNLCVKGNNYCIAGYPRRPINVTDRTFEVAPGMEHFPVIIRLFATAEAYCKWAGKRLPTEAEWEYAARHDPKTGVDHVYPWGDEYRPGVTNHFESIEPSRGRYAPVGTFKDDRSAIGAYDMGGNVSEWVADCFSLDFSCGTPCIDPFRNTQCKEICTEGDNVRCEPGRQARGANAIHDPEWGLQSKLRFLTYSEVGGDGLRCVTLR
jgi:sulfatase modifying factor 1